MIFYTKEGKVDVDRLDGIATYPFSMTEIEKELIEALDKTNKKLTLARTIFKWYSRSENYKRDATLPSKVDDDHGKRARSALDYISSEIS